MTINIYMYKVKLHYEQISSTDKQSKAFCNGDIKFHSAEAKYMFREEGVILLTFVLATSSLETESGAGSNKGGWCCSRRMEAVKTKNRRWVPALVLLFFFSFFPHVLKRQIASHAISGQGNDKELSMTASVNILSQLWDEASANMDLLLKAICKRGLKTQGSNIK